VCAFNIIDLSEFDEQLAFYTLYVVRTVETCAIKKATQPFLI